MGPVGLVGLVGRLGLAGLVALLSCMLLGRWVSENIPPFGPTHSRPSLPKPPSMLIAIGADMGSSTV